MTSAKITKVETLKGDANATLFNPFRDPISLRLTVAVSASPEPTPMTLRAAFEILGFEDNQVHFRQHQDMKITPGGSNEYYLWANLGTAHDLNLNWLREDLFGFRGAAELFSNDGESGQRAVEGAFDISETRWFRLEQVYGL